MLRIVEPEWLDTMPADDPRAIRTRSDLVRINWVMQHRWIIQNTLHRALTAPRRIVELGAGDGTLMLRLARTLAKYWDPVSVVLVDRQPAVSKKTVEAFNRLGWEVTTVTADVFDWLDRPEAKTCDAMLANLFLHHFKPPELATLLALAAPRAQHFLACEPRRSRLALGLSHLVWLLGCGPVTYHDAVISVRAGFTSDELTTLWPQSGWQLQERAIGPLTHFFYARRVAL